MSLLVETLANELKVQKSQIHAAIKLLDEGATVPFIARYRKEATNGLNDNHLRQLEERLYYLRELDERRATVLKSIQEQGKLTDQLKHAIEDANTKTRLEDLYLPFKPKKRTKAQIAREAGLAPLAEALLQEKEKTPEQLASNYVDETQVPNIAAALDGAKQILMEQFAENATLLTELREFLWHKGTLHSTVFEKQKGAAKKFSDYFAYQEPIKRIPSHRALALFRGRKEGYLQLNLCLEKEESYPQQCITQEFNIQTSNGSCAKWLHDCVDAAWKIKLATKLELELTTRLKEAAEEEAIRVFASNLRDLLLLAPAGEKIVLGLDPAIRTGTKVVVIDQTGKLLDYTTIFPLSPQHQWHESISELAKLAGKYNVDIISIGNGTASREIDKLVDEVIKSYPDLALNKIITNEAGASVYSASELAAKEFPELDVSLRGAVSIARRLQDPLAELVKIEPKSIGVGQYQHDVNQTRLTKCLNTVIEDCVNAVGVDLNTASAALLKHVAGLNDTLANNIVTYRNEHGAFIDRNNLLDVSRMGDKTFQQAAGFLRIRNGKNPLDNSAVHPEAYPIVEQILQSEKKQLNEIIADATFLKNLDAKRYINAHFGLPTVCDILKELEKPGRDPRPEFKTAQFKEGIETINDLTLGMILEGVVSNVAKFGAFIDIGVHQDGLVHISSMSNKFISDPREIIKTGDIVKVKVIEIDKERKRIGLTMKCQNDEKQTSNKHKENKNKSIKTKMTQKTREKFKKHTQPILNSAMADAFAKLKK